MQSFELRFFLWRFDVIVPAGASSGVFATPAGNEFLMENLVVEDVTGASSESVLGGELTVVVNGEEKRRVLVEEIRALDHMHDRMLSLRIRDCDKVAIVFKTPAAAPLRSEAVLSVGGFLSRTFLDS